MEHEKSTAKVAAGTVARLSLKVPLQLRRRVEREARRERRTLMAQAAVLIERGLNVSVPDGGEPATS